MEYMRIAIFLSTTSYLNSISCLQVTNFQDPNQQKAFLFLLHSKMQRKKFVSGHTTAVFYLQNEIAVAV